MADSGNSRLCRKFYLTILSAQNLPNVRRYHDTAAYAQVIIGSETKTTKADDRNGLNPTWNHPMESQISETSVLYYGLSCWSILYIGEVHTTIKDLYDEAFADGGSGSVKRSLPVKNGTEKTDGILNICYSFSRESFMVENKDFMERLKEIATYTTAIVVSVAPAVQF